jgi:hypothetical protein
MPTALKTQRTPAGQTDVEHQVIAVCWGTLKLISDLLWENRWPEMQFRDNFEDGLVSGGYL